METSLPIPFCVGYIRLRVDENAQSLKFIYVVPSGFNFSSFPFL